MRRAVAHIAALVLLAGSAGAAPLPSDVLDGVPVAAEHIGGASEAADTFDEPEPLPASAAESDIVPPADEPTAPVSPFPYSPRPWPGPRIVKYIVAPDDTLDGLVERFGADRDDIIKRNRLSKKRPRVRKGTKLAIMATRFPVPRLRVTYVVEEGDTWKSIADGLGLTVETLKSYNRHARRLRHLPRKTRLTAWVESHLPRLATIGPPPPFEFAPTVPEGSLSYGYPHWGRMTGPVALPEHPLYTIRTPEWTFGSTHALRVVQHAIAGFRHESGFDGEILICSISKERGRRFPPHKSHQSGRDIDISLVGYPGFPQGTGRKAHGGKVDWAATWLLMRHFIETDQVTYIFLSYHLQPLLYEAAQALGATDEELERAIQWPRGRGKTSAIVRHSRGHTAHFHVRVKCSPDEPRCKGH